MNGYIRRRPGRGVSLAVHDFDAVDGSHYLRVVASPSRQYTVARYHDHPGRRPRPMTRDEVVAVLKVVVGAVDHLTLFQHESHWEAYPHGTHV